MIDRPHGADNPRNIDQAPRRLTHTPLPNMEAPGPMAHSTPLDREKVMENLQGQSKSTEEDLMMKTLMDSLKADGNNNPEPGLPKPPILVEKKIKVPEDKTIKTALKKDTSQQNGFLTPFVNGLNNTINGIWNALKSLVPMKPQTGAS